MMDGASVSAETEDAPPSYYMRSATFLLSVMALRTARACLLVVGAGYMPEAHGLKRRLSEVHARAQAMAADTSGQHARDWMTGRGPSTPPSVVGKFGNADLWKLYSWGAHADPRSVIQWLSVALPHEHDARTGVKVTPHHDDLLSNALLTEVGTECRDIAVMMIVTRARNEREIRTNLAQAEMLDEELDASIARYYDRVPHGSGGEPGTA